MAGCRRKDTKKRIGMTLRQFLDRELGGVVLEVDADGKGDKQQMRFSASGTKGRQSEQILLSIFGNLGKGNSRELVSTEKFGEKGGCTDGMKRALVQLAATLPPSARIVSTVHDEIIVEAPEQEAEDVRRTAEAAMVEAMAALFLQVPVEVEATVCGVCKTTRSTIAEPIKLWDVPQRRSGRVCSQCPLRDDAAARFAR